MQSTLASTALLTIASAAIAWQWSPHAARGLVIGGAAGALGFWMTYRNARSLASIPKDEIPFRVYRWTFLRVVVYGSALLVAYRIDPGGRAALLGAAGGLIIARVAMIATGILAWRRHA